VISFGGEWLNLIKNYVEKSTHIGCWFSASAGMAQSMPFQFPSNDMAREKELGEVCLADYFGCVVWLFVPPTHSVRAFE